VAGIHLGNRRGFRSPQANASPRKSSEESNTGDKGGMIEGAAKGKKRVPLWHALFYLSWKLAYLNAGN
jgi:hypothetical protein